MAKIFLVARSNFIVQLLFIFFLYGVSSTNALAATAKAIGAGTWHSCAALVGGGVKCWGAGTFGQLGDGAKVSRTTPVTVPALAGQNIISIGGGTYFTCALTSAGAVYCWGFNSSGQLGNGTYTDSSTPVAVQLPTGVAVGLSVGTTSACLLDSFGNVFCWGDNSFGQLNRSVSQVGSSNVPIYAAGQNDVVSISGTSTATCLKDLSGGGKCFGSNFYGQRGNGFTDTTHSTYGAPTYVTGLSQGVIDISAGTYNSCAISGAQALCWGQNNLAGQLGFSGIGSYLTPVVVIGLRNDPKRIYTQIRNTCIVTHSGAAQCWGENTYGQVGRGTSSNSAAPGDVLTLTQGVASLALGIGHSCALLNTGEVKCWGLNNLGQLGDGTNIKRLLPQVVPL